MTTMELIRQRHSVRSFQARKIEPEKIAKLNGRIDAINAETGLHIQFMDSADGVYGSLISRFAGWRNVPSYLALVGPQSETLEETCGYYGEQLVLLAQELGLNTCWAGMVRSKYVKAQVGPGEALVITIAVGYGSDAGRPHKSKDLQAVTEVSGNMPEWFRAGAESALLAPTALNQQKFLIRLLPDGSVSLQPNGKGPFVNVDLGIVKYHFEAASGRKL